MNVGIILESINFTVVGSAVGLLDTKRQVISLHYWRSVADFPLSEYTVTLKS